MLQTEHKVAAVLVFIIGKIENGEKIDWMLIFISQIKNDSETAM